MCWTVNNASVYLPFSIPDPPHPASLLTKPPISISNFISNLQSTLNCDLDQSPSLSCRSVPSILQSFSSSSLFLPWSNSSLLLINSSNFLIQLPISIPSFSCCECRVRVSVIFIRFFIIYFLHLFQMKMLNTISGNYFIS